MLEMARLVGTPPKGIILQTRAGHDVANSQSCEPDDRTRNLYDRFRSPHFDWKNRKPACGFYNCFGLVWASRRTSIYSENDLLKILADDGYHPLADENDLQPGDIVVYLRGTEHNSRDTLHIALVLYLDQVGSIPVPWLLSKWSDQYGEDIHKLRDVPMYYGNYIIELWTDRP